MHSTLECPAATRKHEETVYPDTEIIPRYITKEIVYELYKKEREKTTRIRISGMSNSVSEGGGGNGWMRTGKDFYTLWNLLDFVPRIHLIYV